MGCGSSKQSSSAVPTGDAPGSTALVPNPTAEGGGEGELIGSGGNAVDTPPDLPTAAPDTSVPAAPEPQPSIDNAPLHRVETSGTNVSAITSNTSNRQEEDDEDDEDEEDSEEEDSSSEEDDEDSNEEKEEEEEEEEEMAKIKPHIGFVIKTKRNGDQSKVFINLFYHDERDLHSFVLSSPAKISLDKKGVECEAYDVTVPKHYFVKCSDVNLRHEVCLDAIHLINSRYEEDLNIAYTLPNMAKGFVGGETVEDIEVPAATMKSQHDLHHTPHPPHPAHP